ncbi:CBS domain-containing protein [Candidatus Poriferisodalis sp.]|uniref:CBS domain-containing protein n=1 Tax=Candidatus Poriferisodalis sp. TaxID=3101277 RepID=UPI003B0125C8
MTTDENHSPNYPLSIASIPGLFLDGELVWIPAHKSIESAVTLMQIHKYSQIPVFDSDKPLMCKLQGVITWQSIADARLRKKNEPELVEALVDLPVVERDDELFAAIPKIMEAEAVLLYDQGQIDGIVTVYDLSKFLASRLEPFLIFNEIEIHLRTLAGQLRDESELDLVSGAIDSVSTVSHWGIGQCIQALKNAENWSKVVPHQDREIVVQELKIMSAERNAVMHGHRLEVDGIGRHRHLLDYLRDLA